MLLDPNTLSKDGTVAVASWTMSEDGCYMAYQLSRLAAFFPVLECSMLQHCQSQMARSNPIASATTNKGMHHQNISIMVAHLKSWVYLMQWGQRLAASQDHAGQP